MISQEDLQEKLQNFMNMPSETEWLEFKEAKHSYDFEKLGQYFSALSNEANIKTLHSGWLIFGISNDPPRKIVGTHYKQQRSEQV